MNLNVKTKILNDMAVIPTKGSIGSAGYDLYAAIDAPIIIPPKTCQKIGTGLSLELPEGFFGAIFARSGLSIKSGGRPANCVGVCDADYRGQYIVALYNDSNKDLVIQPNDRIAQLIVLPYFNCNFEIVDDLEASDRNDGGFGSTGV